MGLFDYGRFYRQYSTVSRFHPKVGLDSIAIEVRVKLQMSIEFSNSLFLLKIAR